jgi:diphosphomevalonate decarboxylase
MADYKNPKLIADSSTVKPGSVTWKSPSNIALIKYWGKYGVQLPRNPSISFTLSHACTETQLSYTPRKNSDTHIQLSFLFDNKENEAFRKKIVVFMESLHDIFPFLRQMSWAINTRNSFPHSAGIASSASAMSALALCLCDVEHKLFGTLGDQDAFMKKASYIARLGSGSACRSIYPHLAVWGETAQLPEASNLYAVPFEGSHSVFHQFHDDILLISQSEKSVSSRAGHGLMEGNVYADSRYTQARQRLHELTLALKSGDLESFGRITEAEALTLHALMMSSNPPYILMKPNTLAAIEKIQAYRTSEKVPLYFSLDAGPNLHLLYPHAEKEKVQGFIKSELTPFCQHGAWLADEVGAGPVKIG